MSLASLDWRQGYPDSGSFVRVGTIHLALRKSTSKIAYFRVSVFALRLLEPVSGHRVEQLGAT